MELQEELTSLKAENKAYKDFAESLNAEKIALDQMLVESLKTSLNAKKESIMSGEKVKKLETEIKMLKQEIEILKGQLSEIKDKKVEKEISEYYS